jgi:hypothetical protein
MTPTRESEPRHVHHFPADNAEAGPTCVECGFVAVSEPTREAVQAGRVIYLPQTPEDQWGVLSSTEQSARVIAKIIDRETGLPELQERLALAESVWQGLVNIVSCTSPSGDVELDQVRLAYEQRETLERERDEARAERDQADGLRAAQGIEDYTRVMKLEGRLKGLRDGLARVRKILARDDGFTVTNASDALTLLDTILAANEPGK